MPRRFGVDLTAEAGPKPPECQCKGARAPDQPHHDHIIDAARDYLKSCLGPAFDTWMRMRGRRFYDRLVAAREPCGAPVVRFRTTWVCNECNPADGSRKPARKAARPDDTLVAYYSMHPSQLASCRTLETWQGAYERDLVSFERRMREVRRVALVEVRLWIEHKPNIGML